MLCCRTLSTLNNSVLFILYLIAYFYDVLTLILSHVPAQPLAVYYFAFKIFFILIVYILPYKIGMNVGFKCNGRSWLAYIRSELMDVRF